MNKQNISNSNYDSNKEARHKKELNTIRHFYKTHVNMNQVVYHYSIEQKEELLGKLLKNLFGVTPVEYAEIAAIFDESRGEDSQPGKVFDHLSDRATNYLKVFKH